MEQTYIYTLNQFIVTMIECDDLLLNNYLSPEQENLIIDEYDKIRKMIQDNISELYPAEFSPELPQTIIYCNKHGDGCIQFIINSECSKIISCHAEYTWFGVFKDISKLLDDLSYAVNNATIPDIYKNILINAMTSTKLCSISPQPLIDVTQEMCRILDDEWLDYIKGELCSDDMEKFGIDNVNEIICNYQRQLISEKIEYIN
jgi:hypothetical protein